MLPAGAWKRHSNHVTLELEDVNDEEVGNQVLPNPGTAGNVIGLLLFKVCHNSNAIFLGIVLIFKLDPSSVIVQRGPVDSILFAVY